MAMQRGKAKFVRKATEAEQKGIAANNVQVISINGHERLLYDAGKAHKPFIMPKSYGPGPKAPSDRYDEKKAWAQAIRDPMEAEDCVQPERGGFPPPVCQCGAIWTPNGSKSLGWTYAVCPMCGRIYGY